jgi:2-oxoglutarate ferredoxin oxidoreductase subunit gamma
LNKKERFEVLIAGMGGQGIVLLGTVLGTAAVMYDGKFATQAPSYGTETRGSPAESQVVISPKKIGFPETEEVDVLVAMTQAALNRHEKRLGKESKVIVDSDLVRLVSPTLEKVWKIPATKYSEQNLASRNYANMVMLGAMVKLTNMVSADAARNAIRVTVPPNTVDKNLKAFELGTNAIQGAA